MRRPPRIRQAAATAGEGSARSRLAQRRSVCRRSSVWVMPRAAAVPPWTTSKTLVGSPDGAQPMVEPLLERCQASRLSGEVAAHLLQADPGL